MNYLHENRPQTARELSYQWPNRDNECLKPAGACDQRDLWCGLATRRAQPPAAKREDQTKAWSNDDWAFIVVTKSGREERDERQRLIYPGIHHPLRRKTDRVP
jgi:hypothetical protein